MRRTSPSLLLATTALLLAGCGQKGALYLPDKNAQVVTSSAATPAQSTGSATPSATPDSATAPAAPTAAPTASPTTPPPRPDDKKDDQDSPTPQ